MVRKFVIVVMMGMVAALAVAGCDTMGPNTQRGAIGGGVLGSIAGGVIGHQSGHGVEGALIGATVGALGGGTIGSSIDSKQARTKEEILSSGEKLGISDVIVLSKSGMSDDAIIAKIARSGSVYSLSVEEISQLQKEGVSNRVINYMMALNK
jgi:hypothetical protein